MKNVILSKIERTYLAAIIFSTILALIFVRSNLESVSENGLTQFVQANRSEIASEDTMLLASKINALLASENLQCIRGQLNENEFIKFSKGSCESSIFVSEKIFKSKTANNLEIHLSYRLTDDLIYSVSAFLFAEILMFLFLLHINYNKIKADEHAKELIINVSRQLAHDIRTPLSALNMVLAHLNSTQTEEIELIRLASERINEIANDLLKKGEPGFSVKLDSPNISDSINISMTIQRVIQEYRIIVKDKKHIQIDLDESNPSDIFARGNAAYFSRIISNLLNNSIDAAQSSGIMIQVSLRSFREKIVISVQDSGQGMSAEVLKQIGENGFSFGKNSLSHSGSGLGIYSAKKYLESIGGQIQFSSQLGEGTLVEIILPRIKS